MQSLSFIGFRIVPLEGFRRREWWRFSGCRLQMGHTASGRGLEVCKVFGFAAGECIILQE